MFHNLTLDHMTTTTTPPPTLPPRPINYFPDSNTPPPVPPLPPNFRPELEDEFDNVFRIQPAPAQSTHYYPSSVGATTLVAPQPLKLSSTDIISNDSNMASSYRHSPPQPFLRQQSPSVNPNPGFVIPHQTMPPHPFPSPRITPNPQLRQSPARFSPQPQYQQQFQPGWIDPSLSNVPAGNVTDAMANLSFNNAGNTVNGLPSNPRRPSGSKMPNPPSPPRLPASVSTSSTASSLTAPLPTLATLTTSLDPIQLPSHPIADKVAWIRDVLFLVNKAQQIGQGGSASGTDPVIGPANNLEDGLQQLVDVAIPLLLQITSPFSNPQPQSPKPPPHIGESLYLLGSLVSNGTFPQYIPPNPRLGFRQFEQAARAGYHAAWYKLGRDYESFGDEKHALECFERGCRRGVEGCLYRMGMAHLMGQLGLPPSAESAIPLLYRAATLATTDCPQPAYVFALLLLSEFQQVTIPLDLVVPLLPPHTPIPHEARKHLEHSAYLNFSPAQYKLGHAYEFSLPPFPYSPLLSVQYYSLASQQGEPEADMSLSKWFLCGAEGVFNKDEGLAWVFAEKAARRGLASAQFALGYYLEVGVGGRRDVEEAKMWYQKASQQGNQDAAQRLTALSQTSPQTLSRQEHVELTQNKLVRKRTQAKQRSEASGAGGAGAGRGRVNAFPAPAMMSSPEQVVELVRRTSRIDFSRMGSSNNGTLPQQPRQQQQQPQTGLPPGASQPHPLQRPTVSQHSATLPPSNVPPKRALPQQPVRHGYSLSDNPVPRPTSDPEYSRERDRERPQRGNPESRYPLSTGHPGKRATSNSIGGGVTLYDPPTPRLPPPASEDEDASTNSPRVQTKYETFAEMGFTSQKLEDKECIIM